MNTVCELNLCTACGACKDICPKNAVSIKDSLRCVNAVIDMEKCIDCGLCRRVCQQVNPVSLAAPIDWFQGWNKCEEERMERSSGGFAYLLGKQIIMEGGYVASCEFKKGRFNYALAHSIDDLENFRESKYVKSNPGGIYKPVLELLKKGAKVLFIGLPCHCAALKKYIGTEYGNLITVDLICHGSPSPKLLDLFLQQYGIFLKDFESIHFRKKGSFRLSGRIGTENKDNISFTELSVRDKYTIAFVKGLIYTENCYHCRFADKNRISDITIGDSWGSELDSKERKGGISLALCQTEKGLVLLKRCEVNLLPVDIDKAISSNHQLREPFPIPENRKKFFAMISKGKSFNTAVRKCFPDVCIKADIKNMMIRFGIKKNAGN